MRFLLSTDLASRGLDMVNNAVIVNFDFPTSASDYLHRVGRTGRAGRPGLAISLYRNKDMDLIKELRDSYEHNIPVKVGNSVYR